MTATRGSGPWRIRGTVVGEAGRLFELVERLEELGFSSQVAAVGGNWEVDIRSTDVPTSDLLRRVVQLFGRAFPGDRTASLVLEVGERRYWLGPRPGLPEGGSGAAA